MTSEEIEKLTKENEQLKKNAKPMDKYDVLVLEYGRQVTENKRLKWQIKKMKCCGNCKNCTFKFKYDDDDLIIECDVYGTERYTHLKSCTNWELAE